MNEELRSALLAIDAFDDDDPRLRLAHLGNALSLVHQILGQGSWVGIYFYREGILCLNAFQGTPACEKIHVGKGVVGTCFARAETRIVPDVSKEPNYICCDAAAQSEICIPMKKKDTVFAVFDIDLPYPHSFEEEKGILSEIAASLTRFL